MRRHLVYAAAGAVVLALGGCGGDEPTPKVADPSAAPSASSSASESRADEEPWKEKSDDGAIAFIEHWLDVFNDMHASAETDEFEAITTADCRACRKFVSITKQIESDGGTMQSAGWSLLDAAVGATSTASSKDIAARLRQAAETIEYTDGRDPITYPGGRTTVLMTVVWQGGAWTMDEVAFP